MATRKVIGDALEAGGVPVAFTGKFSAPCALIEAGDPWASVDLSLRGGRRNARWLITLVAGRADSEGALEMLGDLVDRADRALLPVRVQLPTWAKPFDAVLGNVPYAATTATIQMLTEEVAP